MCTCDRVPVKKFAIPFIVLFEVGWYLYTRGLGQAVYKESGVLSATSSLLLPFYPPAVFGQLVVLLILLHALLPPGSRSLLVGALSISLNNFCFIFVGYAIVGSKYKTLAVSEHIVMFIGTILLTVSLGCVQLLLVFDRPQQQQQTRSLWYVCTTRTSVAHLQCIPWRYFYFTEKVRFMSSVAIIISALGWMASLSGKHTVNPDINGDIFMHKTVMYAPPVLYISALLHAGGSGKLGNIAHVLAAITNTFYLVSMGYLIISSGQFVCCYNVTENSAQLELFGGLVSVIFWTFVLILWPLYYSRREQTKQCLSNGQDHSNTCTITTEITNLP